MDKPDVRKMPRDRTGARYDAEVRHYEERMKTQPRLVYPVVCDGYAFALSVDGQYAVLEEYRGTDGKNYEHMRPANEFETHLLRKIEGLNKFFIE